MTAPITPDERAEWRALADAATQWPWEATQNDLTDEIGVVHDQERRVEIAFTGMPHDKGAQADSEFIAAARTAVPRLLDALDTAEARGRMAETNLTVAGRALGKALAKGARTREENRTLRAERDEARAASARVREAAARVVADEAAESDLTIARQRDRLRSRQEQVRRLRAEVTRLHALVADLRAATSPAWDEDTVRAEAKNAVIALESDYNLACGDVPAEDDYVSTVLAVVRRHLPVRPDRETIADVLMSDWHGEYTCECQTDRCPSLPCPTSTPSYVTAADAVLDLWPGESRAQVQAAALRAAADEYERTSGTSNGTIPWLRARADRIEKGETP